MSPACPPWWYGATNHSTREKQEKNERQGTEHPPTPHIRHPPPTLPRKRKIGEDDAQKGERK